MRRKQAGFALLLLLAVVVLVATYLFVNQLNAATSFSALRRDHNAKVLNQAKQALIGHVAMNAGTNGENDPGSFPCPEAPGNYGNPSLEGIAAGNCGAPAVGRLPWRTLGLDKLTDAHGEPLWYVVSPGWHKPAPLTNTVINSNTLGQLSVDAAANDVVALIIAPGAPMRTAAAPGCAAVSQARSTAGINVVNYLECDNATPADNSFVTTGPAASFNDQLLRVTLRDVLPAIEAAVASRIDREISPAMRAVYGAGTPGGAANPMFPHAAPFNDPGAAASYVGDQAACIGDVCRGLLPIVLVNEPASSNPCTPSAGMPLCNPNFVQWLPGGTLEVRSVQVDGITYVPGFIISGLIWNAGPSNCTVATLANPTRTELQCQAYVPGLTGFTSRNVDYEVRGFASNVGKVFRRIDTGAVPGVNFVAPAPTIAINDSSRATVTFRGRMDVPESNLVSTTLCGLLGSVGGLQCRQVSINVPITLLGDPPFLKSADPTLGWFTRNEWYRVLFYAASDRFTPRHQNGGGTLTPSCISGDTCLALNTIHNKRAMLIVAGRSLTGTVGHSRTLDDFLDMAQNRDNDELFFTQPINTTVNDRFLVVLSN